MDNRLPPQAELSQVEREALALATTESRWAAGLRSGTSLLIGLAIAATIQVLAPRVAGDYAARICLDAGIAIILAVSLNIVNGLAGQFSLGHAGFLAVGGYTAGMISYYGSLWLWGSAAVHGGWFSAGQALFLAACLAGGVVGAAVGYLMGLPTLRLRGDYLAIVTLGFGEIIRVLFQQTQPVIRTAEKLRAAGWEQLVPPPVGGSLGFSGVPKYTNLFWVYAFVTITLIVAHRLKFSSAGRNLISIREDEVAALAMGVHVTRWKVRAFVIAAFFAGIAGGLFAHESGIILSPRDAGFQRSIELVIMVVLGGKGSISGVVLAAALLASLPELLRDFDQYRMIAYAVLLIGMMLLRPQGLFGSRELWDLWSRHTRPALAGKESA
jgi:branched-chain amino acid transport system permease protein